MAYSICFAAEKWSTTSLFADWKFEHAIRGLLLSPDNNSVLVYGKEVIDLRTVAGLRIGATSINTQRPLEAVQHPHILDVFIVSDHLIIYIYRWNDLASISYEVGYTLEADGLAAAQQYYSTSMMGNEILIQFSKSHHTANTSTLSYWRLVDLETATTNSSL